MAQEVDPSMAETGQRAAPCPCRNQGKQPGALRRCLDHELGCLMLGWDKPNWSCHLCLWVKFWYLKHFETHFLAGSFEQHVAFPALKDTPYLLQGGPHSRAPVSWWWNIIGALPWWLWWLWWLWSWPWIQWVGSSTNKIKSTDIRCI